MCKNRFAAACVPCHKNDLNIAPWVDHELHIAIAERIFNACAVFAVHLNADELAHVEAAYFAVGYVLQDLLQLVRLVELYHLFVIDKESVKLVLRKIADDFFFPVLRLFGVVFVYQVLHTGICRAHLLNVPVLKCLFDVLELDGVAELKENVEMFGYLSVGRLVSVMTD